MNNDRYGDNWDKPFLFLAHTATKGICSWCMFNPSEEIHHAYYKDAQGEIKGRELPGISVFPVCKQCHSKQNPDGCHGQNHWNTRQGINNRNTDLAIKRLKFGYQMLSRA